MTKKITGYKYIEFECVGSGIHGRNYPVWCIRYRIDHIISFPSNGQTTYSSCTLTVGGNTPGWRANFRDWIFKTDQSIHFYQNVYGTYTCSNPEYNNGQNIPLRIYLLNS